MRYVFIGAGLSALVASTAMAIGAVGGLSASSAPGLVAMAIVLAVGAAAIGHALARKHSGLALMIGVGMMAGEAGAMLQTAQRITAAREAQRAPLAALAEKRQAAIDELAEAETAKPEAADRTRLDTAERAKTSADTAARDKSSEKGCRENCRLLLQSAVDNAQREVESARADVKRLEGERAATLAKRIADAKAAIAALQPPQSATPLADNTGIPEWLLDVLEALSLSLAINLPASALIALGVKMAPTENAQEQPKQTAVVTATTVVKTVAAPALIEAVAVTPRDHAAKFGREMMAPADESTPVAQLHRAYVAWCHDRNLVPFPAREIGSALVELFGRTGVRIGDIQGKPHVLNARIRQFDQQRVLGPMTTVGVHA